MKKFMIFVVFLLTISFWLSIVPKASAADSTPSADIRSKLEELKKEIASKAAKIKLEVDRKSKDKVFIGKVTNITETVLILETKNGSKNVNMSQDTVFGSDTNLKYSKKLLEKNDYVAALGDVDDTESLVAKKIVLQNNPPSQPKTYLWGQIISTDDLVTLKDKQSKNIAVSLISPVKIGNFVILTGKFSKNDIFETDFVYVIPQGGILKPKSASHSASPSSSPRTF